MGRRAMTALAAATITLGTLAGCGGVPDRGRAREQIRDLTHAEQLRISAAEQRLIKRCMRREGFTYWEWEPLTVAESRPIGYVQDDVGWAHRNGYGSRIAAKSERARQNNPNGTYRRTLSKARARAYDETLAGGPDARLLTAEVPGGGTISRRAGGCAGEAEAQLYGDLDAWFRADKVADNLRPLYVPDVMRDEQFLKALRAWSACMRRAGHDYPDPGAARADATKAPRKLTGAAFEKAFRSETEIATADADCARETSLKSIGKAREAYYVEKLNAEYGDELATLRQLQWDALTRARKLVGPRI